MSWFSRSRPKGEFKPVYAVILKADRHPTQEEIGQAIGYFMKVGCLESPPKDYRVAGFYDPDMATPGVDGKFMRSFGSGPLDTFPDLKQYISVTSEGFRSDGLTTLSRISNNAKGSTGPTLWAALLRLLLDSHRATGTGWPPCWPNTATKVKRTVPPLGHWMG